MKLKFASKKIGVKIFGTFTILWGFYLLLLFLNFAYFYLIKEKTILESIIYAGNILGIIYIFLFKLLISIICLLFIFFIPLIIIQILFFNIPDMIKEKKEKDGIRKPNPNLN